MANDPLLIKKWIIHIKNKNDKIIMKLFRTLQPSFKLLFHRTCTLTSRINAPSAYFFPSPTASPRLSIFEYFEKKKGNNSLLTLWAAKYFKQCKTDIPNPRLSYFTQISDPIPLIRIPPVIRDLRVVSFCTQPLKSQQIVIDWYRGYCGYSCVSAKTIRFDKIFHFTKWIKFKQIQYLVW